MPDGNSLGNSPNIDAKTVEDFCHLFEVLLCFEAWYQLDAFQRMMLTVVGLAAPLGLLLKIGGNC